MSYVENVLIYRETLLPLSETFVLAQGEALRSYRPFYVGRQRCSGLSPPLDRMHVLQLARPPFSWGRFKLAGQFASSSQSWLAALAPALVHVHFGSAGPDGLWLSRRLNCPLIVTYHGHDATVTTGPSAWRSCEWWVERLLQPAVFRHVTKFLAVSDFIADRLRRRGVPEDKILRHYIGIESALYQGLPRQARDDVVLFVGRLVEKKGVRYLIDAMARIQTDRSAAELVVIGDGPLRDTLEAQARQLGVRARFLGSLPHADVKTWMARAKVFCLPSVIASNGDAEGLNTVCLESMASGTPVVGFRHAGIPEAVLDGVGGYLVPERDSIALAERILALWDDADLWQRMSEAALERVQSHFELSRQTALLEDIYRSAIESYRRRQL